MTSLVNSINCLQKKEVVTPISPTHTLSENRRGKNTYQLILKGQCQPDMKARPKDN